MMVIEASGRVEFAPVETMELVGGELCLDFVNTASRRTPAPLRDRLATYHDLLYWAERAGAISGVQARTLRKEAGRHSARAEAVLARARVLREAIYQVVSAHALDEKPGMKYLGLIGDWASGASAERRLVARHGGFALEWPGKAQRLEQPLWVVAASAAALLTSPERLARVKECRSDGCNWLFLDMSKNRSRRWCDMRDCGNRAKARRHYHRNRAAT